DIPDVEKGCSWLTAKGLLAPSGSMPLLAALAKTLFQVGALPNTPLQTLNGIQAVAFLLQESEIANMAKEVSDMMMKELTSITDRIQTTLREKMEEAITKLHEKLEELGKLTTKIGDIAEKGRMMATPYQDALNQEPVGPPVQVDPWVRAKESIRARQFLWTLSMDTQDLKTMLAPQLLKHLNTKLDKAVKMTREECRLCSAVWLKNGGMLVKAEDDKSATWLCSEANILHMECKLETSIVIESHNYSSMAYFIPLTFNAMERSHIEEVAETNNLPKDSIKKCRWAKAPEQHNPNQTVGHIIITFTDPDSTNQAILNGLVICNKKVLVTKCKREPVRCLKCQGYNHVVNECIIQRDICAKCGENHRASECNSPILTCTPCRVQGHASSNWTCPTFLKKCTNHEVKNPENLLPFFPSKESWTWESMPPSSQRSAIPLDL
ncbi:hypothetical protein L208DRAFT_992928, partial [Tricholoma matsutake]